MPSVESNKVVNSDLQATVISKINDYIKTEDDLAKLNNFKINYLKENEIINNNLKFENNKNLNDLLNGLDNLKLSHENFNKLKENIDKIDALKYQTFSSINRYDLIKKLAKFNESFNEIQLIYDKFNSFQDSLKYIEELCDYELSQSIDIDSKVSNLLNIHFHLNNLRDFKDKLFEYSLTLKNSNDDKRIITFFFKKLDQIILKFDKILKEITQGLIESIFENNFSLIIRLIKIIEFEEREDLKFKIIQNLIKEKNDQQKILLKHTNRTSTRNYKENFFKWNQETINDTFENCKKNFFDDENGDKFAILNNLNWIYRDLSLVQLNCDRIFPKRWQMFDQYYSWYYENLNKILVELIEAEPETSIILDILNFDKEHAQIMSEEFHIPKSEVVSLIGEENKEKLLKDYLNLIISMTNNWMDNVHNTERDIFLKRNIPPDTDGDGRLFLQGSKVVFQMFSQQCDVAASSGQAKILLGVIEHFCGLLVDRSAKWQILINEELSNYFVYLDNQDNMEFNGGFIEYLIAVGNDQINSCDLLESLGNKFVTYVSSKYKDPIKSNLNLSIEKSIDVSETVRDSLLQLIYNDVKPIFDKIFTKSWYLTGDDLMKQLVNTMEEYFHEFKIELHKEIYDSILEDSFNDIVILKYLQRLKNSVKFNNKKISDVIKRDLKILYGFFINYLSDNYIEQQFRIFEILMELIDLGSNPSNQRLIIEKFNNEYLNDFNDFSILFLNDILKNCNTYSDKKISLILNELENDKKKFTEYVGGEENIVLSFMSKY